MRLLLTWKVADLVLDKMLHSVVWKPYLACISLAKPSKKALMLKIRCWGQPNATYACDPYYLTIALLNVRSIVADIHADKNLRSASILCFCETWLNPTPALLDDEIDIRCDRVTSENKGDVLICVPSLLNPMNVQGFVTSGIEALSATASLCTADFSWYSCAFFQCLNPVVKKASPTCNPISKYSSLITRATVGTQCFWPGGTEDLIFVALR